MALKILFAIGDQDSETILKEKLEKDGKYKVCSATANKHSLLQNVDIVRPDVIILHEMLPGPEDIATIVRDIRAKYEKTRIIFISKEENKSLFAKLVFCQVFDIFYGDSIRLKQIKESLDKPRTFKDVSYFVENIPDDIEDFVGNAGKNTEVEEEKVPKKKGLFGLKKKDKKEEKTEAPDSPVTDEKKVGNSRIPPENEEKTVASIKEEIAAPNIEETHKTEPSALNIPKIEGSEKELKEKLATLEDQESLVREEVDSLSMRIAERQRVVTELENEKTILYRKYTENEDLIPELEATVAKYKALIEERGAGKDDPEKVKALTEEAEQLKKELSEIKVQSDNLEELCNRLTAQKRLFDFLSNEIPEDALESSVVLMKFLDTWEEEYEGNIKDISEIRAEIDEYAEKSRALNEESIKWQKDKIQKKVSLENITEEIEKNKKDIEDLTAKLKPLEENLNTLKEKRKEIEEKIEGLNKELNKESKEVSTAEDKLKKLSSYKELSDGGIPLDIAQLKAENDALRASNEKLKGYKDNSLDLASKLQLKDNEIKGLKEKLQNSSEISEANFTGIPTTTPYRIDEEKETLRFQNEALLKDKESLMEESQAKDSVIEKLKGEIALKDRELDSAKSKLENSGSYKMDSDNTLLTESKLTVDNSLAGVSKVPRLKRTHVPFKNRSSYTPKHTEDRKVIGFVGAHSGVGNSTIALNVAALLAKQNNVLYIETNPYSPTASIWLFLSSSYSGLEDSIVAANSNKTDRIFKNIVKPNTVELPKSLHLLYFSEMYRLNPSIVQGDMANFDNLVRQIKMSMEYDYIIIDISPLGPIYEEFKRGLIYVDKLFVTTSQDICALQGCFSLLEDHLSKNAAGLIKNMYLILNKFDPDCSILERDVSNFVHIDEKQIIKVMLSGADLIDCVSQGQCYSLIGPSGHEPFVPITESL